MERKQIVNFKHRFCKYKYKKKNKKTKKQKTTKQQKFGQTTLLRGIVEKKRGKKR